MRPKSPKDKPEKRPLISHLMATGDAWFFLPRSVSG
jgi:hypothetical protein